MCRKILGGYEYPNLPNGMARKGDRPNCCCCRTQGEPTRPLPLVHAPGTPPADPTSGPVAPPPQDRPIALRGPGPSAALGSQICVLCHVVVSGIGDNSVLGEFLE